MECGRGGGGGFGNWTPNFLRTSRDRVGCGLLNRFGSSSDGGINPTCFIRASMEGVRANSLSSSGEQRSPHAKSFRRSTKTESDALSRQRRKSAISTGVPCAHRTPISNKPVLCSSDEARAAFGGRDQGPDARADVVCHAPRRSTPVEFSHLQVW